jgi:GTPase
MSQVEIQDFKAGYIAIVGRPNVGKSTLVNKLLKFKLSITTPKPQTTRHRIQGILTGENYQIILLDTPGVIEPAYLLQNKMMKSVRDAIQDADLVVFVVEASAQPGDKDLQVLQNLKTKNKPILLVINKIDLMEKSLLLPVIEAYRPLHSFVDIVPVSALHNENVLELEKTIVRHIPPGIPFFPTDMVTEHPERFFVSEIIREKIFQNFGEEVPYSTAVVIDEFKEQPDRKDLIRGRIIVERASQKSIIIGKGGSAIKKVGQQARQDIEQFLGRPVYLELWVAVREKWRSKETFMKEFGYDNQAPGF